MVTDISNNCPLVLVFSDSFADVIAKAMGMSLLVMGDNLGDEDLMERTSNQLTKGSEYSIRV